VPLPAQGRPPTGDVGPTSAGWVAGTQEGAYLHRLVVLAGSEASPARPSVVAQGGRPPEHGGPATGTRCAAAARAGGAGGPEEGVGVAEAVRAKGHDSSPQRRPTPTAADRGAAAHTALVFAVRARVDTDEDAPARVKALRTSWPLRMQDAQRGMAKRWRVAGRSRSRAQTRSWARYTERMRGGGSIATPGPPRRC
jgi:hypothetical protein